MVSGSFTDHGHSLVVVGYIMDGAANDTLTHIIVDDPFGDFNTHYQDHRGNDVPIEVAVFKNRWPGWYHQFRRGGI